MRLPPSAPYRAALSASRAITPTARTEGERFRPSATGPAPKQLRPGWEEARPPAAGTRLPRCPGDPGLGSPGAAARRAAPAQQGHVGRAGGRELWSLRAPWGRPTAERSNFGNTEVSPDARRRGGRGHAEDPAQSRRPEQESVCLGGGWGRLRPLTGSV